MEVGILKMNKGFYIKKNRIKSYAKPIDNITKFAWDDEDYEEVEEWIEYTDEELAEMGSLEKRNKFLSEAPDTIAEQDDAICALYEKNLALKATAADQDDAICYLFELITEKKQYGK